MNGHRISLPVIVTLSGVLSSFFVSLSEEASVADPILKGSPRVNRSVSVYTSTVNNGTFYPTLLGGSSLLDGVYESFNSTGLMALGGVLLAAGSLFALQQLPEPDILRKQVTDIVDFIPQKLSQLPRVVNGRLAAAKAAKTHNVVDNYLYVNTGANDAAFLAPRAPPQTPVHFNYQTTTSGVNPFISLNPTVPTYYTDQLQLSAPPTTPAPPLSTLPPVHRDVYRAPGPPYGKQKNKKKNRSKKKSEEEKRTLGKDLLTFTKSFHKGLGKGLKGFGQYTFGGLDKADWGDGGGESTVGKRGGSSSDVYDYGFEPSLHFSASSRYDEGEEEFNADDIKAYDFNEIVKRTHNLLSDHYDYDYGDLYDPEASRFRTNRYPFSSSSKQNSEGGRRRRRRRNRKRRRQRHKQLSRRRGG